MSAAEVLILEDESPDLPDGAGAMVTEEPGPLRWTREMFHELAKSGILGDEPRIELLDGEIYEMCPMDPPHSNTVRRVRRVLERHFGEGFVVSEGAPLDLGQVTEPYPDVSVCEGTVDDFDQAHPTTSVLVIEVSDTTLYRDRNRKSGLYARAGIEEYWIVDLVNHRLEVRREPDSMPERRFGYGYKITQVRSVGELVSPRAAPHVEIPVESLLPPSPRKKKR